MADWSLPTLSTLYTSTLDALNGRDEDAAKMFDGTGSNLPVGTVKWNSSTSKWEKYDGASWNDLASVYAIKVNDSNNLGGAAATNYARLDAQQTFSASQTISTSTTYQLTIKSSLQQYGVMLGSGNSLGAVILLDGMDGDFAGSDYASIIALAGKAGEVNIDTRGKPLRVTNYEVWHEGNDGANSGLDADLLDGLHGYDYLTKGNQHAINRYKTPGDTDLNWKVLYEVSMDDTTYEACLIRIDHSVVKTNFGHDADVENYTFYVSMRRSDGTVNGLDDAVIYGTDTNLGVLKVIKRATGDYVVLVRPSDVDRNDQITSQILSIGSGTTATYYDTPIDGSTITGSVYYPQLMPQNWQTVTYENGWTNYTADVKYWKDSNGVVHLQGTLDGAGSTSPIAFTLPASYVPFYRLELLVSGSPNTSNPILGIDPTGEVSITGGTKAQFSISWSSRV